MWDTGTLYTSGRPYIKCAVMHTTKKHKCGILNKYMTLVILILAAAGFFLSLYIHHRKRTQQKMVCIMGHDCEAVVNSEWGKVFGVPNEILGMLYYVFIAGGTTLIFLGVESSIFFSLPVLLLFASGAVMLVSIFLVGVQAFVLKDWCDLCLTSTGINIAIFVIEAVPFLALYEFL